ncbi:metal-dependent transcriptional regulator [Sphingobacterium sp. SYP-B4668]|uniref:metal-dependent transcriptional regulator n=1 Tax=Sphingobacterium sp. SYP-B4668 TaxID=2996035 RepID=UPI0022DE7569|nr:metal-dependent transcriptional regulator [Sphingobacterium sp. SYP-B4668]
MYSAVEENYLKAILSLENDQGEVSINELSKRLDLKMPTVNGMIKKFSEKGLVHYESYKPLKLTKLGKKEAAMILRKHRLTEMFLFQKMGFGWEEVHAIAEQIEHIQSPKLFEKMDELLGYPKFDPHGSPIPDIHGKVAIPKYKALSTAHLNTEVVLMAISDSSEAFLQYLNSKNIQLGAQIKIIGKETFDGNMTVSINGQIEEVFSSIVCEKLLILH